MRSTLVWLLLFALAQGAAQPVDEPVELLTLCALCALAPVSPTHAQSPERGDVRIVVLSDFNGAYGSLTYSPHVGRVLDITINTWQPDLLLSAGDVIGGQNTSLPAERFAEMWGAFDAQVARPLREAGIPYAFATGNHDGSSLRNDVTTGNEFTFQRERDAAQGYWRRPLYETNLPYQSREGFPFNYSFTFGELFIVVWDASSARITEEQRGWAARELSRSAARNAKLRVLLGHLPFYGVSEEKTKPGEVLENGDELRRWLEQRGLDLYISGHHAAYYPAKVGGVTLLHSGGIGARRLLGSEAEPRSAVTLLDIDLGTDVEIRLTTFDAATLEVISPESLPERLGGLNGPILRYDLAP